MTVRACLVSIAVVVAACATGSTPGNDDEDPSLGGSPGSGGNGIPGACGNGVLDGGEQCDGNQLGMYTCEGLGFMYGVLACEPSTCVIDASQCFSQVCPNGIAEPGEDCDGADLGGATCASLGFNGGTLSCDAMCRYQGCSDVFVEDFEGGALGAGWSTSGSAMWFASATLPHAGSGCAESGNIDDLGITTLTHALTFGPAGSITFWHRESTESGYDYLNFYIDGLLQGSWDGENGWTQATFNVAAGAHTLEWRYEKDGSLSNGSDAVYIDDIAAVDGF